MKRRRLLLPLLDRYILRQLTLGLIAVTGGMTALIWLTQSLRFVGIILDRGLSFQVFMHLTGLLVPGLVAVILPITLFVVVQFVYYRLAGDRELTAMGAAGISTASLTRPALLLGFLVSGLCYGLNIWVVPASITAFRRYEFEIRNRLVAVLLQDGVFTSLAPGVTLYIRSRDPDGALHGVLLNDAHRAGAFATILAQSGRIVATAEGPRMMLENGSREQIDRRSGRLDVLTFRQNVIDLGHASSDQGQHLRDASEMPIRALLHPDPRLISVRERASWLAEAEKRLAGPLAAITYTLIALGSVLRGMFRRYGGLMRPAVAVVAVVGLLAAELAADNFAARSVRLLPLIWINATVPLLAAFWLLFGPALALARKPRPAVES